MSIDSILHIVAGEFDTNPDRNSFIELAKLQVNSDYFNGKYDMAVAYMAAHLLKLQAIDIAMQNDSTSSGQIISKKEGDLQISYARPQKSSISGGDDDLNRTTYGKQFIRLRNSSNVILSLTDYVD